MNICKDLMPILKIVGYLLNLIQWAIPVLLIILVTIDVFKIVSNAEQKEVEKIRSNITNRLIYAIVVFLVPLLVKMLFGLVGDNVSNDGLNGPIDWIKCFNSIS